MSALARAVGKAEQLLLALRRGADDDQDVNMGEYLVGLLASRPLGLEAGLYPCTVRLFRQQSRASQSPAPPAVILLPTRVMPLRSSTPEASRRWPPG